MQRRSLSLEWLVGHSKRSHGCIRSHTTNVHYSTTVCCPLTELLLWYLLHGLGNLAHVLSHHFGMNIWLPYTRGFWTILTAHARVSNGPSYKSVFWSAVCICEFTERTCCCYRWVPRYHHVVAETACFSRSCTFLCARYS